MDRVVGKGFDAIEALIAGRLAGHYRGLFRSVVGTLGVLVIAACGGDGGGGDDEDNRCSRYAGETATYFYLGSGRIDSASFSVTSRLDNGAWLTAIRNYDAFDDGSVDSSTRYSYFDRDSFGNLIRYRVEWDGHADGSVDEVAVGTYTRNSAGQRLTLLEEIDLDTDGIYDMAKRGFYIYDGNGHGFRERIEIDHQYDGVVDELFTFVYSYNANGDFSSSIRSHDSDNDGNVDGTSREIYSFIYDGTGRQTGFEVSLDEAADGSIEEIHSYRYRFESFDCDNPAGRAAKEYPHNDVSVPRFDSPDSALNSSY